MTGTFAQPPPTPVLHTLPREYLSCSGNPLPSALGIGWEGERPSQHVSFLSEMCVLLFSGRGVWTHPNKRSSSRAGLRVGLSLDPAPWLIRKFPRRAGGVLGPPSTANTEIKTGHRLPAGGMGANRVGQDWTGGNIPAPCISLGESGHVFGDWRSCLVLHTFPPKGQSHPDQQSQNLYTSSPSLRLPSFLLVCS